MFVYGVVAALTIVGIHPQQLPVINVLFRTSSEWKTVNQVPTWAIWMLGLTYFIIEEILLQQAKLLWDDIRDKDRDKLLLTNQNRAIASGQISKKTATIQMFIRWSLAFIFGYLVGHWPIFWTFLAISVHQAIYELWGKPRGATHPVILLCLLAFNSPLRSFAGMVSMTPNPWQSVVLSSLLLAFYFNSFGAMAGLWRIEAEDQQKNKEPIVRPQGEYYLQNGTYWQRIGFLSGVLSTGLILIFFKTVINMMLSSLQVIAFVVGIGVISAASLIFIWYIFQRLVHTISLILHLDGRIFNQFKFPAKTTLEKVFKPISNLQRVAFQSINNIRFAAPLIFLTAIGIIFIGYIRLDPITLFYGLCVFNLSFLFQFEGITYPEYALIGFKKRLPYIIKAWVLYIFKSNSGFSLAQLLMFTFIGDLATDKINSIDNPTNVEAEHGTG